MFANTQGGDPYHNTLRIMCVIVHKPHIKTDQPPNAKWKELQPRVPVSKSRKPQDQQSSFREEEDIVDIAVALRRFHADRMPDQKPRDESRRKKDGCRDGSP